MLFCLVPITLLASDNNPAWSPDGKKLVFMSDRDGDIEIYVVSVDGTGLRRLTNSPGRDAHPAFSRDGTKIAFQSPRGERQPQIYVMNADGSQQTRLTDLTGFSGVPDWSPDDKQIAFQINLNPTLDPPHWQLFRMNSDGSGLKQITHDNYNDQVPKWSPDGKRILFYSDKTGHNQIYTMRADGSDWQPVLTSQRDDSAATWSHDGQRILFTSDAGQGVNIYTYDLRTKNLKQLTTNAPGLGSPFWSTDEKTIAFTLTRGQQSDVYLMNADGSNQRKLLSGKATEKIPPPPGTQAVDGPRPGDRFLQQVNRPVVYRMPEADTAKVRVNISYKKDPTADFLRMDLYTPANAKSVLPIVILIHGGVESDDPLRPKDWGFYKSWGRLIAASGMAAVTFNHRVGFPDPNLEQGSRDVEDLIGFVRTHSDEWGLDRNRICLAAYSAGGPMLSMAMRDRPPYIRCLVGFYPFLDIQESALHKKYLTAQQLTEFSPIHYLAQDAATLPPIFVARAGRDQIPDLEPGLDRFIAEAVRHNIALEFMNHPHGVHSFDSLSDDDRSREIVKAAIEFIKAHLSSPEGSDR